MVVDVFTGNVLEQADLVTRGLLLLLEGEESSSLRRDTLGKEEIVPSFPNVTEIFSSHLLP